MAKTRDEISHAARRILDAMLWMQDARVPAPWSRVTLAFAAEHAPAGGHYTVALLELKDAGLVHYPRKNGVAFTEAGREQARRRDNGPVFSLAELQARACARLARIERRILPALIAAYPERVERASLVDEEATEDAVANAIAQLIRSGCATHPTVSTVAAADTLFPEIIPDIVIPDMPSPDEVFPSLPVEKGDRYFTLDDLPDEEPEDG